uniref:F-actin-capping protein subunit alpha n=1 Tax=Heligmosomoides polygyrus TaxID=6339 RepID=A0A183GUH9_HELPZ
LSSTDRNVIENKLQSIKDPKKVTTKQFLSDLASYKDQQLFNLITAGSPPSSGFDDDFADVVITPNYIRRVVAPQTCAISKQELVHLVKSDHVQV